MARARALALGLALAALPLVGAEGWARRNERDIDWVPDQPGRGYATPGGQHGANARGFHEREPAAKPAGTRRVAVVGDSVTWGGGLALEETLTRVAEADLAPDWQVLNYATYGYDTCQAAATLRHVARADDPDLVVYAAYPNDLVPTELIYVGPARAPVWVGADPWPLHGRSALVRRVEGVVRARGYAERPDPARFARCVTELLDAAGDVPVAALVLLPHVLAADLESCDAAAGEPGWCAAQLAAAETMQTVLAEAHVPNASTLLDLRHAEGPSYFPPDAPTDRDHPNAAGARVFGQALAALVRHVTRPRSDSDRAPDFPG